MSRQVLAGAGVGLLQKVPILGDVAGTGVGVLFLSFSRGQERESDQLGVEYSTRLGYDANRMADFFGTLERLGEESEQRLPGFLSTHPDPGDRQVRVAQLAGEWQQKIEYKPRKEKPGDFLKHLDGLAYGPDPRQGFVEHGHFYHPALRFQFPVPRGWELHNSPALVDMVNEDQSAIITFTISRERPAAAAADSFLARSGVTVASRKPVRVQGYQAIAIESSAQGSSGEIRILSHFIAYDSGVYVFHGFTRAPAWGSHAGTFRSVAGGFDRLTNSRLLGQQPARLRTRKAPRAGDLGSVIQALGVVEGNFSKHAILNGRSLSDPIEKGTWIKIIDRQGRP
jgi:predicted Zn-dependent protease